MSSKFNSIRLTGIRANFLVGGDSLEADAAFVNTTSGDTHGWTKGSGPIWSRDVKLALDNLKELMEQDLRRLHFDGDGGAATAPGEQRGLQPAPDEGGLGEHVGDGVKQV